MNKPDKPVNQIQYHALMAMLDLIDKEQSAQAVKIINLKKQVADMQEVIGILDDDIQEVVGIQDTNPEDKK